MKTKTHFLSIFALSLLVMNSMTQDAQKCCSMYDKSNTFCLSCPDGTFMFGNNCKVNINNCQKYSDCFSCLECTQGYKLTDSDTNGINIKSKKCISAFVETEIDLQKLSDQGRQGEAFSTADQYMKAFHSKQILKAITVSALHKKHENGSEIVVIQYQNISENKQSMYYKAVMFIDLKLFSFVQLEFKEILKTELRSVNSKNQLNEFALNTAEIVGTKSIYQNYSQIDVDLASNKNSQLVKNVNLVAQGAEAIYKKLVSMKVRNYKNGTQQLEVSYQTKQDLIQVVFVQPNPAMVLKIIVAQKPMLQAVSEPILPAKLPQTATATIIKPAQTNTQNNLLKIEASPKVEVKQTVKIQNIAAPKQKVATETPTATGGGAKIIQVTAIQNKGSDFPTRTQTTGYESVNNIDLLKKTNFLLVLDILKKKKQGYEETLPKSAFSKIDGGSESFILIYELKNANIMEILAKAKSSPPKGEIIQQRKIGVVKVQQPSMKFTTKEVSQVTKDSLFVASAVQMKKISDNYINNNLIAVGINDEDPNTIYYKCVFCVNGIPFEVQSSTKRKLRTAKFISQKQLKPEQGYDCKKVQKVKIADPSSPTPNPIVNPVQNKPVTESVNIIAVSDTKTNSSLPTSSAVTETPKSQVLPQIVPAIKNSELSKQLPNSGLTSQSKSSSSLPSGGSSNTATSDSTSASSSTNNRPLATVAPVAAPLVPVTQTSVKPAFSNDNASSPSAVPSISSNASSIVPTVPQSQAKTNKSAEVVSTSSSSVLMNKNQSNNSPSLPTVAAASSSMSSSSNLASINKQVVPSPQPNPNNTASQANTPVLNNAAIPTNTSTTASTNVTSIASSQAAPTQNQTSVNASSSGTVPADKNDRPVASVPAGGQPKASQPQQILPFSKLDQLPPQILSQISGFSQITEAVAKKDPNFLKVQVFIQTAQNKIIKNASIVAAFNKTVGFTVQFKIYYLTPDKFIHEAFVAMDRLRNKCFFVNFAIIIHGAK